MSSTRTRRVEVDFQVKRCAWCRREFEARRSDARFCPQPAQCRIRHSRWKRSGKRKKPPIAERRRES